MSSRETKVFFFGDSICFGQGVSPHLVWVSRLSQKLAAEFEGELDITVQNPSVNGNTTRMALERIGYDVQSHCPQVLIIQYGLNDCNGWETDAGCPRVSPAAFKANLGEIIERGRNFGARQVILGTNHATTRTRVNQPGVNFTYQEANRRYNEIIREAAAKYSTDLVDNEKICNAYVESGKATLADLLLVDELHLSKLGHDIYLSSYYPHVAKAVRSLAGLSENKLEMAS